jgi:hypothetical protein
MIQKKQTRFARARPIAPRKARSTTLDTRMKKGADPAPSVLLTSACVISL